MNNAPRTSTEVEDCTVLYTNTDSYLNKRDEFILLVEEKKKKLIALTEILSKRSTELNEAECVIPGYDMFINKSPQRGVVIYAQCQLNAKECETLSSTEFNASVWCEFIDGNNYVLIGCIYRRPTSTMENTQKLYNLINNEYIKKCHKVCIVGDFN